MLCVNNICSGNQRTKNCVIDLGLNGLTITIINDLYQLFKPPFNNINIDTVIYDHTPKDPC